MTPCTICGGQGFVYRARLEGGRAIWNAEEKMRDVIPCPLCFLKDLTGV